MDLSVCWQRLLVNLVILWFAWQPSLTLVSSSDESQVEDVVGDAELAATSTVDQPWVKVRPERRCTLGKGKMGHL